MAAIERKSDEDLKSFGDEDDSARNQAVSAAIPPRKRGKTLLSSPLDAVTVAAIASAVQHMTMAGYHGVSSLLTSASQENHLNPSFMPQLDTVRLAAKKAILEQPVWVHWSKQDMAPSFKCDGTRLSISGVMRGYRMARASHGVSSPGCYYFECILAQGPSATEILHSLPPNARLGPGLREKLQTSLEWDEKQTNNPSPQPFTGMDQTSAKKRKEFDSVTPPVQVGGHVRIGWSMRTGDLQAPVGYDKWSYGIRDIDGSIIHCSQRQESWGGEGFNAGDVIGCAICIKENVVSDDDEAGQKNGNHIRFFKNGECMGQFVISKGKREGGEAFSNIQLGTYYPAFYKLWYLIQFWCY